MKKQIKLLQNTNLLPKGTIIGPALIMVTAIMCFLACLTVGASLISNNLSQRWLTQASSALTVQIVDHHSQTAKEQLPAVLKTLQQTPGIHYAEILPDSTMIALLEPWLGTGNVSQDLPLPILIDLVPDAATPLNIDLLNIALKTVAPGASLDTHGRWRHALEQTINILRLLSGFILLLVTCAAATVIIFATRAALSANTDILDVLYLAGAYDDYIVRQFEFHFLKLAFWAGFMGYFISICAFLFVKDLLPDVLDFIFYMKLAMVPIIALLMTWVLTRHYVMANIRRLEIML